MEHEGPDDASPEEAAGPGGSAPDQIGAAATLAEHAVHGYSTNKQDYLRRLRRIEGQTRGLQRMITDDE